MITASFRATPRCGSRRSNPCWSKRASSIRPLSMPSSITTNTRSAPATAPASSPAPGPIPPTKPRLLADATAAIAELGFSGAPGRAHGRPSRTRQRSTTSSSAPSAPATPGRSWACRPPGTNPPPTVPASVIDPRGVLKEFGLDLPDDIEVRVWDSTAELRYLVLPERPAGTENLTEEQLAALVTRDSMIGVAPRGPRHERRARHGRHARSRTRPAGTERARLARALGGTGYALVPMGLAVIPSGAANKSSGCPPPIICVRATTRDGFMAGRERGPARADHAGGSGNRQADPVVRRRPPPPLTADQVDARMKRGHPRRADVERQPVFQVGDAIRTRNIHPLTHTRLPRYRPRQARRHLAAARRACVSRTPTRCPGRERATALHGEIPGTRSVGRGSQSSRHVCIDLWEDYLASAR